jgi:hypothetical protein
MKTNVVRSHSSIKMNPSGLITNTSQLHVAMKNVCNIYGVRITYTRRTNGHKPRVIVDHTIFNAQRFCDEINQVQFNWKRGRQYVIDNNLGRRWGAKVNPNGVREYCDSFKFYVSKLNLLVEFANSAADKPVPVVVYENNNNVPVNESVDPRLAKLALLELECYIDGVISELHYVKF